MKWFCVLLVIGITALVALQERSLEFEVVSIKPLPAGSSMAGSRPGPTGFNGYFSVTEAASMAFQIHENRIVEGPRWTADQRYQINATTARRRPGDINQMMRHLLEERFSLKVHRERRPIAVYALARSRSNGGLGPRLQRRKRDCMPPATNLDGCSYSSGPGRYRATGQEWRAFVAVLDAGLLGRPVLDKTGLYGQFDITLEWNPDIGRIPKGISDARTLAELESRPVLFTAFQDQLGLKLETDTAPIDVLVIDSVKRPTPE